jgi:endonuclease/exonuclease/phosphatase family metal-dependent hydrolase
MTIGDFNFLICCCVILFNWRSGGVCALKVSSYNIKSDYEETSLHWGIRKDKLLIIINNLDSDVYCLQELSPRQILALNKYFKMKKFDNFIRGRDMFNQDEALAIYWKKEKFKIINKGFFWLSNFPFLPGSKFLEMEFSRIALWVHLQDFQGINYLFINVHLDDKGKNSRLEAATLIFKQIEIFSTNLKIGILILCGDFNEIPTRIIIKKKIIIFIFLKILNLFKTTYHNFGKIKTGNLIDFILIKKLENNSKNSIEVKYSILKNNITLIASDHFPITSNIIFKLNFN